MLLKKYSLYSLLIFFITGLISGLSVNFFLNKNSADEKMNEQRQGGYNYINPLLECDHDIVSKEMKTFKSELVEYASQEKEKYDINLSAIYFRDLNNGPWIGINEKENFSPASMLKIPLMISAYKLAEKNPNLLNNKIKITQLNDDENQFIKPSKTLENGKSYTIDELVERMIIYSDNSAQAEIFKFIGGHATTKSFSDLGLAIPIGENLENFMSVKEYASFFRILYNASYLDKNFSEKSLEILTKTEFKEGLAGDLPKDLVVANKFGERLIAESGEKQLHDCGIIYYRPNHPYLLCIMNRGKDFQKMVDYIKSISSFVYREVASQYE